MATYAATDAVSATLTLLTVDTVTCSRPFRYAVVTNRSANEIYVRTDGVNPTVGGTDCVVVLAGSEKAFVYENSTSADIRLIASLATTYSIEFI